MHWLRLEGEVSEIYDVQVLPGARRPMALGFHTDEIARLLTLEPCRRSPECFPSGLRMAQNIRRHLRPCRPPARTILPFT